MALTRTAIALLALLAAASCAHARSLRAAAPIVNAASARDDGAAHVRRLQQAIQSVAGFSANLRASEFTYDPNVNYITPTKVQGPPGTKVVPTPTPAPPPSPAPAAAGAEAPKERAAATDALTAAPPRMSYVSFGDFGTVTEWFRRP